MTARTTTSAPLSGIVNTKDKKSNAEWVVRALMEGCNKDGDHHQTIKKHNAFVATAQGTQAVQTTVTLEETNIKFTSIWSSCKL